MDKPWEERLVELWHTLTRGKRWIGTAIVIVFIVIPGASGVLGFYAKTFSDLWVWFRPASTSITPDEYDVLNEWVAPISYWPSLEEAQKQASNFKTLYLKYEDVLREGQNGKYPVWRDDILVARDPTTQGRWMVVIDTFYGTSSYPAVTNELARLSKLGANDTEAQNTYQRFFVNSQALCYSQRTFERTYGRIEPVPDIKRDPQGHEYPPCDTAK